MPDSKLSRRSALSTLGVSTLGLLASRVALASDAQRSKPVQFSDASFQELLKLKNDPKFDGVIPALRVKSLAEHEHWDTAQVMMALLPLASSYSRAPISNFHVG